MTYRELTREAADLFEKAGIQEDTQDAKSLLFFLKKWGTADYLLHADDTASEEEIVSYRTLAGKRAAHIPLQHITGTAPFFGYDFIVNENVLIPRFDTEVLAEEVLSAAKEKADGNLKILDLCTGSGCIAIALEKSGLFSRVSASDISYAALETARKNAKRLDASVEFIESDLFENIGEQYDFIVSNPPYIATEVIGTLEAEVKDHDPVAALDGGADGLDFYRRIAAESRDHLVKGGGLFLEIGDEQAGSVSKLLKENGYREIRVIRDLSQRDRVITCLTD